MLVRYKLSNKGIPLYPFVSSLDSAAGTAFERDASLEGHRSAYNQSFLMFFLSALDFKGGHDEQGFTFQKWMVRPPECIPFFLIKKKVVAKLSDLAL